MAEGEGDFRVAGAYVELGVRDHTDADVAEIRARIQAEDPAKIRTEAEKPSIESLAAGREEIEKQPVAKIPAQVDKDKVTKSAEEAGKDGGSLMAPAIAGALIAGGPLVGAAMTGVGILGLTTLGVALQKDNPVIRGAWSKFAADAGNAGREASQDLVYPISSALGQLDGLIGRQEPLFRQAFAGAAADIPPLMSGITSLADQAMPGFSNAMSHSQAIAQGMAADLGDVGGVVGELGNTVATNSGTIGSDMTALGSVVTTVGHGLSGLIGNMSQLAAGALPALGGGVSGAVSLLGGLENVTKPIAPELGAIAGSGLDAYGSFKLLSAVTDPVQSGLGKVSSKLNDSDPKFTRVALGAQGLTDALSKAAGALPAVGAGLSALEGLSAAAFGTTSSLADSLLQNADAAGKAANQLGRNQAVIDGVRNSVGQYGGVLGSVASGITSFFVPSQQDVYATLTPLQQKMADYNVAVSEYGAGSTQAAGAAKALGDQQTSAASQIDQMSAAVMAASTGSANAASSANILDGALKVLGQDSTSAAQRLSAVVSVVQALDGEIAPTNDALSKFYGALDSVTAASEKGKGSILDATGALNEQSQAGRDVTQMLDNAVAGAQSWASAQATAGKSASDIAAGLQGMDDKLVATLEKMGLNASQAQTLAAQYLGIPTTVATLFTDPGAAAGIQDAMKLKQQVDAVPNNKGITVSAPTGAAIRALEDLGYRVVTLPNGQVRITADTTPAQDALNNFIRTNSGRTIAMGISTTNLRNAAGGIVAHAAGGIDSISASSHRGIAAMAAGGSLTTMQPIAQVVPPNTMKVVGDRTTGDEAFIPLQRNDSRAQAILAEVNNRMGTGGTVVHNHHNETYNVSTQDPSAAVALLMAEQQWQQMIRSR